MVYVVEPLIKVARVAFDFMTTGGAQPQEAGSAAVTQPDVSRGGQLGATGLPGQPPPSQQPAAPPSQWQPQPPLQQMQRYHQQHHHHHHQLQPPGAPPWPHSLPQAALAPAQGCALPGALSAGMALQMPTAHAGQPGFRAPGMALSQPAAQQPMAANMAFSAPVASSPASLPTHLMHPVGGPGGHNPGLQPQQVPSHGKGAGGTPSSASLPRNG